MAETASSILGSLSTIVVLAVLFGYLYHRRGQRHLLLWAVSWTLQGGRLVVELWAASEGRTPWLALAAAVQVAVAALLLLAGCSEFLGRRLPAVWSWLGALAIAGAILAAATGRDLAAVMLGPALLSGVSCVTIGWLFIRGVPDRSAAAGLAGWSFVLWGLHKLDYPWLQPIPALAPWGYLLASVLALLAALGLLLSYLESAQREVRESEERYRLLVEQAADAIFLQGEDGAFQDANEAAEAMLGYSRDELLSLRVEDLLAPAAAASIGEDRQRLAAGETVERIRELRRRDGRVVPTEIRVRRLPDGRHLAIVRDITARVAAEQALRESTGMMESILRTLRDAVVLSAPKTNLIESCNPAIEAMLGHAPSALRGQPLESLLAEPMAATRLCAAAEAAIDEDGYFVAEGRLSHANGAIVPIEYQLLAVRDEAGEVLHWLSVIRDISERRRAEDERAELEEQLRGSQKMEAIGKLAGGVAHDFNNLLTSILGYADFIASEPDLSASARADLAEIRKAGERASVLTRQLLAFGRRQLFRPTELDLNALLTELSPLLLPLLGESIRLEHRLRATAWVQADASQLEQVVVNLVVNARDAIQESGVVSLETADLEGAPAGLPPGRYLRLTVRDSGCGMSEETRARAFEPFFTTQPRGQATGLGLSTAYGIIKQSEGEISIETEPGAGTAIQIYLPAVPAAPSATGVADRPTSAGAGARVLLVEDDEAVRNLTARSLTRLGLVVRSVGGPTAALRIAKEEEPAELLLTDVILPEMNGPELAAAVQAIWPRVAVLYLSGYAGDRLALGPDIAFLAKPFTSDELAAKIASLLSHRSGQPAD